ncbi:MAG: HAMP domain-containing sensor histidine kinase [Acidimicrobiia bacterium]
MSPRRRTTWSGRAVVVAVVFAASFGLFGLGVLLSNTYGAAQVADNARQLHWTNATLGTSGIARAAVAQAIFFSFEEVSGAEDANLAIAEARSNLDAVVALAASPDAPTDVEFIAVLDEFTDAGYDALDLAEAGDSATAEAIRLARVEGVYEQLQDRFESRQAEQAAAIAQSEQATGRISRITFVAISFVIPAIVMVSFWLALRSRVRAREAEMRTRLETKQQLLAAKDEFIAGLSHELRTPLTTIVGFSELMLESHSLNERDREQLGLIHGASSDLSRMVQDLLTAARLDAGALTTREERFDLAEAVKAATTPFSQLGEQIDVGTRSIEVFADPLHVRQVVQNLVSNAIRHGGEWIVVSMTTTEGFAHVVVKDNGEGVSQEVERRLFERFVNEGRDALVAGSVGLGLAISRELATRMGGRLEYDHTDGWTAFSLSVPLSSPGQEAPAPAELATRG